MNRAVRRHGRVFPDPTYFIFQSGGAASCLIHDLRLKRLLCDPKRLRPCVRLNHRWLHLQQPGSVVV